MTEPHSQIRQSSPEIREDAAGAVHASRNTSFATQILQNRWVQGIAFALAIGAFLSFIAAFNTGDLPFVRRTAIFLAYSLYGGLLAGLVNSAVARQSWVASRPGMRPVVVAAAMTVLMAISIWASLSFFAPTIMTLERVAGLFVTSLVMSATITAIGSAVFRPARFTHAAAGGAAKPRFLDRLPLKLRGAELWAIEAEDHYLRLHTSKGDDLILMRLADAIGELEGIEGAQIHRSWWVARAGISEIKRGDGKVTLVLPSGMVAPVSRTYAPVLRKAGWL